MKKTVFSALLLAGLSGMATGCGNSGSKEAETVAHHAEEAVPTVEAVKVNSRPVDQTATYSSTVEAYVKNNIAPQTVGRIQKINVEVGDFVKAGQIVAEIDKVNLLQAELQMKNNEVEYQRLKGLYEAGGLSKSDLDAIELAYNVSKTSYENLLENTVLRSPIDGVITARNYDKGDMFSMGQPIYTVEQIMPVKLYVGISESDYTKIKKGDTVEITTEAFPGKVFYGKVNRLNPTIDATTHTFDIEVVVDNRYKSLRPGMYARVTVKFGTSNNVVVPDVAVVKQTGSGERFIYVLNDDNTVSYTNVKIGRRMGAEYEILEGIEDGATIVTSGQARLKDGIKVSIEK
ncbi:MAG: efflux RND transporter periplasmic adaptor subunit [Bacteroidales bacterium]|nr:efflux RND transporter periplasmic adaptor subunit [Bacteroides sp.]MCM1198377.1 efflux RND transporter periplasmic adaptor subunit [Clostridium sp.]MCM1503193.1 efflux RND transporter periplasmic adaptor subunit [Bacteroidales bacterium]